MTSLSIWTQIQESRWEFVRRRDHYYCGDLLLTREIQRGRNLLSAAGSGARQQRGISRPSSFSGRIYTFFCMHKCPGSSK
jgi:hypothetical protein